MVTYSKSIPSRAYSWSVYSFSVLAAISLFSCSGGGSSSDDSGTPVSGTGSRSLSIIVSVEAEIADAQGKRAPYVGYETCAFQVCAVTNDRGEASFVATVPSGQDEIEFTVAGAEFSAMAEVPLPSSAADADVILLRPDGQNALIVGQVKYDGVEDMSITPGDFNDGD